MAVICEALTDNKNRTAADVRHAFDKNGGSLGATGCVSWMFDTKGLITIENDGSIDEDELMMDALDAGADDTTSEDGYIEITTDPQVLGEVRDALIEKGYTLDSAEVSRIPQNTVSLSEEQQESIIKMIDMLEENDDVQNVYHNAELDED